MECFESDSILGIVIATPAPTHYQISKDALLKGKHVLVEKPMSLNLCEAEGKEGILDYIHIPPPPLSNPDQMKNLTQMGFCDSRRVDVSGQGKKPYPNDRALITLSPSFLQGA